MNIISGGGKCYEKDKTGKKEDKEDRGWEAFLHSAVRESFPDEVIVEESMAVSGGEAFREREEEMQRP